jgi:hypothetical protein
LWERAIERGGETLRNRARNALRDFLPGFDLDRSIDDPAVASMSRGRTHPSVVELDHLGREIEGLLRHHDVRAQFELLSRGDVAQASGVFSARSIEAAGAQLRVGPVASALVSSGLTLRLTAIDQQVPDLGPLCWAFDAAFGARCVANVYMTSGSVPGTASHFDHHDVVVVQLVGQKHWRVSAPPVRPTPGVSGRAPVRHPDWEGTLCAGDYLCLPRGWIHEVLPSGEHSVHLTIGIRRPAYADLLADVSLQASQGDRWAEDLPGVPSAKQGIGADFERRLGDACRHHELTGAVQHVAAGYRAKLAPRAFAPFSRVVAAAKDPLEWSYRWAVPSEPVVVDRPEGGLAAAGWLIEPGGSTAELLGDMVALERWTPPAASSPAEIHLLRALLELDVLDPVPPPRQDLGR